jgi:hypothetical protein
MTLAISEALPDATIAAAMALRAAGVVAFANKATTLVALPLAILAVRLACVLAVSCA